MFEDKVPIKDLIASLICRATATNRIDQVDLLMLVYLCDWHSCVKYGRRFTNVVWSVSRRGIAEKGLESYIRDNPNCFVCDDVSNLVVSKVRIIPTLSGWGASVIERICSLYREKTPSGLITFAMSTYPVLSSSSDVLEVVDLLQKSKEYLLLQQREE